MKARHFRKLRKKLKDRRWLENKLKTLAERDGNNQHFYKFECSKFFNGEKLAELNKEEYYRRQARINRQYSFIARQLDKLKN